MNAKRKENPPEDLPAEEVLSPVLMQKGPLELSGLIRGCDDEILRMQAEGRRSTEDAASFERRLARMRKHRDLLSVRIEELRVSESRGTSSS